MENLTNRVQINPGHTIVPIRCGQHVGKKKCSHIALWPFALFIIVICLYFI